MSGPPRAGAPVKSCFTPWNPDVVVTDLLLPDLDGLDVLQRLKRGAGRSK